MQTLILVGASVRAAAFSALRAGFRPYAIDHYADRDLAAICPAVKVASYGRELLEALEAAPAAPWIYTGGLENHPRLVDRLAKIRPLLGNPGEVLRRARNPVKLAEAAREAGLAYPEMKPGVLASGAWLVKPRRGSGGLGVRLATALERSSAPSGSYLQEHIAGDAASAVFVAAGGRARLLGATRQLLGSDFGLERPFLYAGSIGPLVLRHEERAKLEGLGNHFADRFGLAGLFNVDFVRTRDTLWVIEVNPRYSASIEVLERVTGADCIGMHIAACEGAEISSRQPGLEMGFAGKAIVYAQAEAIISPAFDRLVEECNRPGQPVGIADLPRIGDAIKASQPVVTVFAAGSSAEAVELELRNRVAAVQKALSA